MNDQIGKDKAKKMRAGLIKILCRELHACTLDTLSSLRILFHKPYTHTHNTYKHAHYSLTHTHNKHMPLPHLLPPHHPTLPTHSHNLSRKGENQGWRTHACLHLHSSIRQHTSAYVSIRQHTSAYVSIRGVHTHACTCTVPVPEIDVKRVKQRVKLTHCQQNHSECEGGGREGWREGGRDGRTDGGTCSRLNTGE
jgi:hypothetical protein